MVACCIFVNHVLVRTGGQSEEYDSRQYGGDMDEVWPELMGLLRIQHALHHLDRLNAHHVYRYNDILLIFDWSVGTEQEGMKL